jgi:hypothetical protein
VKTLILEPGGPGTLENMRRIQALMLSPSDKIQRKQVSAYFCASDLAGDIRHHTDMIELQAWIVVALIADRPGPNVLQKLGVAEKQGRAAGELLFQLFSNVSVATFTKTDFQSEDSFSSLKKEISTHLGMSDAWLDKAWATFKPAAHLWAAAYVEKVLEPQGANIFASENATRFIACAAVLERFAVNYRAARQHKSLIDAEIVVSVQQIVAEEDVRRVIPVIETLLHAQVHRS